MIKIYENYPNIITSTIDTILNGTKESHSGMSYMEIHTKIYDAMGAMSKCYRNKEYEKIKDRVHDYICINTKYCDGYHICVLESCLWFFITKHPLTGKWLRQIYKKKLRQIRPLCELCMDHLQKTNRTNIIPQYMLEDVDNTIDNIYKIY